MGISDSVISFVDEYAAIKWLQKHMSLSGLFPEEIAIVEGKT